MAISNVSNNPFVSSTVNPAANNPDPFGVNNSQNNTNQKPSATVTLSAQGKQLSQSQATNNNPPQSSNTVNTPAAPNVVPQSSSTNAAPGIQLVSGERKGGQVNTYA